MNFAAFLLYTGEYRVMNGNFMSGELIGLLPQSRLFLRVAGPDAVLSPDDPLVQQIVRLYMEAFEGWGTPFFDEDGHNLALEYITGFPRKGIMVTLELHGHVVGCVMIAFGAARQIVTDLVESIATSYDGLLDRRVEGEISRRLAPDGCYLEISEVFLEVKPVFRALIRDELPRLLDDLVRREVGSQERLSPAGERTLKAIQGLARSFRVSSKYDQQMYDLYRLLTLFLLLGSLVYAESTAGFYGKQVTCVQWTCVGTPMHSLFRMVFSSKMAKRLARVLDATVPLLNRVASRLPDNRSVIGGLISLGKDSTLLWEGQVGDGTRPKTNKADYNRIAVTSFPLDGILALIYDWRVYSFFVRGRIVPRSIRLYRPRREKKAAPIRLRRRIIPTFKFASLIRLPRRKLFSRPKFSTPKIIKRGMGRITRPDFHLRKAIQPERSDDHTT